MTYTLHSGFQETVPKKTIENTVEHRDGGVGLVIANHRGGGGNSVTTTTLRILLSAT